MAKVEPLWEDFGYSWEDWDRHAHEYGAGPVTVTAKEKWMIPAVAEAVRRWNESIGFAVFKLDARDKKGADIVVKIGETEPNTGADAQPYGGSRQEWIDIAKQLRPPSIAEQADRDDEAGNPLPPIPPAQWAKMMLSGLLTHELGHMAGLGHPQTPATAVGGPYADSTLAMSNSGGVIAPIESDKAGDILYPVAANPNRQEREREHLEREQRVNKEKKVVDNSSSNRDYTRGQL